MNRQTNSERGVRVSERLEMLIVSASTGSNYALLQWRIGRISLRTIDTPRFNGDGDEKEREKKDMN